MRIGCFANNCQHFLTGSAYRDNGPHHAHGKFIRIAHTLPAAVMGGGPEYRLEKKRSSTIFCMRCSMRSMAASLVTETSDQSVIGHAVFTLSRWSPVVGLLKTNCMHQREFHANQISQYGYSKYKDNSLDWELDLQGRTSHA